MNFIKSESDVAVYNGFDEMTHPIYKAYDLKLNTLQIEKRYEAESLKPKLNLIYNFLTEPISGAPISSFSTGNYKFGVEFGMPILFRKQRGEFQLSKVRILETEFAQKQKLREIENKVDYYFF